MSKESFAPLLMASFSHDVWMALWDTYGDPQVPLFPKDILSLAASVLVSSTPNEITPPDTPIDSIDLVPTTYAYDLVQQEIPCLPTSASCDDFLPYMAKLLMESHIEDVGDIIKSIHLLFVEETTSYHVETNSDTSDSASIDS